MYTAVYLNYASLPHSEYITMLIMATGQSGCVLLGKAEAKVPCYRSDVISNAKKKRESLASANFTSRIWCFDKRDTIGMFAAIAQSKGLTLQESRRWKQQQQRNFSFMIWKIHEAILSLFKHDREYSQIVSHGERQPLDCFDAPAVQCTEQWQGDRARSILPALWPTYITWRGDWSSSILHGLDTWRNERRTSSERIHSMSSGNLSFGIYAENGSWNSGKD